MPHTIERTALLKILLHAIKYPAFGVNGVLISKMDKGSVTAVDAVPFVHNYLSLVPAFEAALCQVDAHVKASGGKLQLLGYYQANEHSKDTHLSGAGKQLAAKLAALYPGAIALVVGCQATEEQRGGRCGGSTGKVASWIL